MEVKIKDRNDEIEWIRISLCMVEIGIDYPHADLIDRVMKALDIKKGEYSLINKAFYGRKRREQIDEWLQEHL